MSSCEDNDMGIERREAPFPGAADNRVYTLENRRGISVSVMNYGATIVSLRVPDRNGRRENIAMSLASPTDYVASGTYAGATLGPIAGRIRNGEMHCGKEVWRLDRNEGKNSLHGGTKNFSRRLWKEKAVECHDRRQVLALKIETDAWSDGLPGNRAIEVSFTLDDDSLTIAYATRSDAPTWLNLSNHSYFNLSGNFTTSALGHELEIASDKVLFNDAAHLPVSLERVEGTPFDFRKETSIKDAMRSYPDDAQIRNAQGYNNAYAAGPRDGDLVRIHDPESGRVLCIDTDYPSIVFYSGGYLDGETVLEHGIRASPGCALAFEAQKFPDALSLDFLPDAFRALESEERHWIRYRFSTANYSAGPNT